MFSPNIRNNSLEYEPKTREALRLRYTNQKSFCIRNKKAQKLQVFCMWCLSWNYASVQNAASPNVGKND